MTFTVRPIRSGEVEEYRSLRLRALADSPIAFASTLEDMEARPLEYWEGRLQGALEGRDSALFIAEVDDVWVGLVGGYVRDGGEGPVPYLISMWVDPAYRGRGVGRALAERVIEWARERGFDSLFLEVVTSNHSAVALYTRCGFRPTGDAWPHPTYPGLEEAMMRLSLDRG